MVAECPRAGHWHQCGHGRLRIQKGTWQAPDVPGRASSRTRQSHNIPEDACRIDSRRVPSTTSCTRYWRAPWRETLNQASQRLCTHPSLWSTPQFQLQVCTNNAGTRADSAKTDHYRMIRSPGHTTAGGWRLDDTRQPRTPTSQQTWTGIVCPGAAEAAPGNQ